MTNDYWKNVCTIQKKQTDKGILKYGQVLEENLKMTMTDRIEYLQEEMIDALMYCEHLKVMVNEILAEIGQLKEPKTEWIEITTWGDHWRGEKKYIDSNDSKHIKTENTTGGITFRHLK